MTSLECWRKCHQVRILEKSFGPVETGQSQSASLKAPLLIMLGDYFTVGPSAIKVFRNWPELAAENEKIIYDLWISYHKHTGECIVTPGPFTWDSSGGVIPERIYPHHRPKFYRMLLTQLEKVGIKVEYDMYAVDY